MEKKQGKLPVTEFIELESNSDQWTLLASNLITEIDTVGFIRFDGKKVKVEIKLQKAFIPDPDSWLGITNMETGLSKSTALGYKRIFEFIHHKIEITAWVLIGYIKGEKNIPITIAHYTYVNQSIYSQKLNGEDDTSFAGFSLN